jgi:hypothetical protein
MKRRRKKPSKARNQKKHAVLRALQRYGRLINTQFIMDAIQSGESTLVEKSSLRSSVHKVMYDGVAVFCVYDRKRQQISSFLDPEWFEDRNRNKELRFTGFDPEKICEQLRGNSVDLVLKLDEENRIYDVPGEKYIFRVVYNRVNESVRELNEDEHGLLKDWEEKIATAQLGFD